MAETAVPQNYHRALAHDPRGSHPKIYFAIHEEVNGMSTMVRQAGDRLLGMFLPKAEAGACVPSNGTRCSKACFCTVVGGEGKICYFYYHGCDGTCHVSSIRC
jgi:hypothetical protein